MKSEKRERRSYRRHMFKSIFSKYFAVVTVTVLVSFVALCGAQTLLSSRYWTSEKRGTLCKSADTIADYTSTYIHRSGDVYLIADDFKPFFTLLAKTDTNLSRVLVTSTAGNVVLSTTPEIASGAIIGSDDMANVQQNCTDDAPVFLSGTLGGLYGASQYTGVAAVTYDDEVIAYVFVSSPAGNLSDYLFGNLQVFFWSALTVLALTFTVMYVMTFRLVRPLRQMAEATRRFADGDFRYRLPVNGDDEIAQLAASLNSMAVSLSSLEEMRRSFVANVSHELKTPMTTIAGFIDGILDGTIPPEKHNYYLRIVSDEVKRLSRLVKSMLDLSRIDSGQLQIKPVSFDLTEVACNVLLSFEQRLEEKNVTVAGLEDTPRMMVMADFDLIGQVVYNLVDNATKFIDQNGTLTIRLERRGNRVYAAVRNTGAGIAAEEMPHIFERFYKTDRSRSLDKKGVGLGLYIVKNVISLHGAEITVRSAEGEFCEFEFWLPAAP